MNNFTGRGFNFLGLLIAILVNFGHLEAQSEAITRPKTVKTHTLSNPLGLARPTIPLDNPLTTERVRLGRKLFFDRRLSLNNSRSCATCHLPSHGFAENRNISVAADGRTQRRNAPSILNASYLTMITWDGRFQALEAQALEPFSAWGDMGLELDQVLTRIRADAEYRNLFRRAFGSTATVKALAQALACYERSLQPGGTRFDQFLSGNQSALTDLERQGFELFKTRAQCVNCHNVFPFADSSGGESTILTDLKFHNLGVGYKDGRMRDLGRYEITRNPSDWGAFRTPSLRNVDLTAPYMHDGSLATLEDVIEFYDRGGKRNPNLSLDIKPLDLTAGQKRALSAFLRSLTDPSLNRE